MLRELKGRLMEGRGHWLWALVFFIIAAIVQTWPLVLHASDRINDVPEQQGDTGYYIWNLWWIKHSLIELHTNPYHTDLIFFPEGADLYVGGVVLVSGLFFIPLQLATGSVILSANILALLLFVLSGLSMYALAHHITHNRLAALASGFIFAFAPFTVSHFQGGEWNHSATWTIPLFGLFLLRFQETLRLRDAAGAGICLAVIIWNWLEYGTDAALFSGLFMVYWSVVSLRAGDWPRLRALWRGFGVVAAVTFVLTSPLVIQALRTIYGEGFQTSGDEFYSADLASYVTPSPLWGPGEIPREPYGPHLPVGSIEGTSYLGIVALVLAALSLIAVRRTPHRVFFWGIVFLAFATLALGPHLYVDGSKTVSLFGLSFSVPLPYQIFDELPIFGSRRFSARLIVFGIMGLSVLAGVGFDAVTSWLGKQETRLVVRALVAVATFSIVATASYIGAHTYGADAELAGIIALALGLSGGLAIGLTQLAPVSRRAQSLEAASKPLATLVAVLVLGLVVLDYWNPPVHLSEVTRPAILQEIKNDPGDFVVLNAPLGRQDGYFAAGDSNGGWLATYYQWMHERPTIGGYVPRGSDLEWIMQQPGLHYLACHCADYPIRGYRVPDARFVFRKYDIKYVVLHKRGPGGQGLLFVGEGELAIYDSYLRKVLNFTPIHSDAIMTVYQNRDPDVGGE